MRIGRHVFSDDEGGVIREAWVAFRVAIEKRLEDRAANSNTAALCCDVIVPMSVVRT